jgi:hypothetical protein
MKVTFVGNGPSLTLEKLEAIEGPSFACNRIHLLYDKTDWRPDFYVYTDRYANPQWGQEIHDHLMRGYPCFIRADIAYSFPQWWRYNMLRVLAECPHRPMGNNLPFEVTEPWEQGHPWHEVQRMSVCTYGGALNTSAQLAYLMGFDHLHLLGCDGVYKPHSNNHSDLLPGYADTSGGEKYDERMTGYVNHRHDYVHQLLETELPARGMRLTKE